MKNPFKKDQKSSTRTLQDVQKEFQQYEYVLGDRHYQKYMLNQRIGELNNEINTLHQKLDALGKEGTAISAKMKAEVETKVEEGKTK